MTLTVVGIGAEGWSGLGGAARAALTAAPLIVGSARQLALLPAGVPAERLAWPSPMEPLLDALAAGAHGSAAVLASGDPMLHGVGASLVRRAGPGAVRVLPHPSAFALACARMGWPQADVALVSAVGRPVEVVVGLLQRGRRIVAYVAGEDGAAALARVLVDRGFGSSPFAVLEQLGGPEEVRSDMTASDALTHVAHPLHVVAVTVDGAAGHPRTPGLPDDAFASDGQLTKRHVRAVTVAALGPRPGELLWDIGAGNGSIAIEWLRAEPTASAVAIESREDRAARIAVNALALGVPHLRVVNGSAPEVLAGLPRPAVIFIGGGITTPGLLEVCWAALPEEGRLVANTVTLEGEQAVIAARRAHGGTLTRLGVAHAEPVGAFTGWRSQMPVVQWSASREH